MSQDFSTNEPDRSKPRYQPPSVPGASNSGVNGGWPSVPSENTGSSGTGPVGGAWGSYQIPVPPPPPAGPGAYGYQSTYSNYAPPPMPPVPPFPVADPQAEAYRVAARRVKAKLDFYKHLTSYIIINAVLWMTAIFTHGNHFWPIYITAFWGIGLASQAWNVFGSAEYQRHKMIEDEMRRMRHG